MFPRAFWLRLRLLVALGVGLIAVAGGSVALATDLRGGQNPTVGRGETLDQDLYIAGNTVLVDGQVDGDVQAAGGDVTVNGIITGSVNAAGGTVKVNGHVSRGVRLMGSTLDVGGQVGREVAMAGADVKTEKSASIGGDLLLGSGTTTIDGTVGGDVRGNAVQVNILGTIDGDVVLDVSQLTLEPGARIKGNLIYTSGNELILANDNQVGGRIERHEPPPSFFDSFFWRLVTFFMTLVFGAVVVAVFPRPSVIAAQSIRERPWWALLWGLLALLVPPTAAVILALTVVGLPLGILDLLLWAIAIYVSQIFVSLIVGVLILRTSRPVETRGALVMAFVVGFIVVSAVTSVLRLVQGLAFLTLLIDLAILLLGLGSMWMAAGVLWRGPRQAEPAG